MRVRKLFIKGLGFHLAKNYLAKELNLLCIRGTLSIKPLRVISIYKKLSSIEIPSETPWQFGFEKGRRLIVELNTLVPNYK